MSVPARFWALTQDTKGSERQVLNCLADWMIGNDAVVCWPSVETIAFETGCNRQTVMKATASLKQAGLITKKRRLVNDEWRMHYTLVGYVPSEWVNTERPTFESTKNRKYEKPDLQDSVRTGNSASESPKNRTSESTAFRTLESTKTRTRTGNNKEDKERNKEDLCALPGARSAIAAVASAQAQMLPTSFPQSSNSQNHSETKTAGKDSLPNASERSVAAHRDRLDASDEQTIQNDAGCSQNASTRISGACPENEPPPMSDEDLENLFADAQLEECPPFPEKGVRPPFEKGVRLPEVSEKGDHLSTATKRRATPRRKTSTPCPFDMESSIPDEYLEIAKKAGIGDPQRVFSSFVAHAVANGRRLIVWPAGFRNWCDNELKWHPDQKPKPKPLHQRIADDYNW